MGKSYTFDHEPQPEGQTNAACELTGISDVAIKAESFDNIEGSDDINGSHTKDVSNGRLAVPADVTPGDKDDPYRAYRYVKQITLVAVYVAMGLLAEITGPTIPDLTERLCVNYEEISRALLGRSIGVMIGAVAGGFLNEIFYKQGDLLMSLSLMVMAVACFCLPLVDSLSFVFGMLVLNGFGEGIVDTGGNVLVMRLWEVRAAPHLHTLHFGFGLGALLAPQIARPFLSPDIDDENYTICDEDAVNGTVHGSESRIEIAYGIISILAFFLSLLVLGFYIRGPPEGFPVRKPSRSLKALLSPASCSRGYTIFGIELLLLLFLYFLQAVGGEAAYGKFLFSFAIESDVQFTKDEASYLQSAFWASFTFGRLIGGPIATCVPVNYIIIGNIIGGLITAVVLAIWAPTVAAVLWVFTCLLGLFLAMAYPNGMSWSNLHLDMNSMGVMLLTLGGSCGSLTYQALTGSLFENVGPETLMYVMVGQVVAISIVYTFMQALATWHSRRVPKHIVILGMEVEKSEQKEHDL